jgi:hypothetical protein
MVHFSLIAYAPWVLRLFAKDKDTPGWDNVASSWVLGIIFFSLFCTLLMLGIKWWWKESARGIIKKLTWSNRKGLLFMISGFAPTLLSLLLYWYSNPDYETIIGVQGLIVGVFSSWVLYLVMYFAGHMLTPWRREFL